MNESNMNASELTSDSDVSILLCKLGTLLSATEYWNNIYCNETNRTRRMPIQKIEWNLLLLFVIVNAATSGGTAIAAAAAAAVDVAIVSSVVVLFSIALIPTNYSTWHTRNASHFETSVRKISMNNGPFSNCVHVCVFHCEFLLSLFV